MKNERYSWGLRKGSARPMHQLLYCLVAATLLAAAAAPVKKVMAQTATTGPTLAVNVAGSRYPISPTSTASTTGWLQHFISVFGNAAHGGVQFYQMDNEPSGWGNTHRDIHPGSTSYDDLRDRTYTSMVKATDPSAKVLGPSDFGWPVYVGLNSDVQAQKLPSLNTTGVAWSPLMAHWPRPISSGSSVASDSI